jgi:hypothetical protein
MDNKPEEITNGFSTLFKLTLLKNVLFTIGAIALFVSGVIVYGIILNLRAFTLSEAMSQKGFTELENQVNILIDRKTYTLSLYEDTVFIKSYQS